MYTEEDKRDMREMFDDYIRLRIREMIEGIKESASVAMWQVDEKHRYCDWEGAFKVSFNDILKRVSEIEGLLSQNEVGKGLMEHDIYSFADYNEKKKDECLEHEGRMWDGHEYSSDYDDDEDPDEEEYDDDDDDAVYVLTDKGKLAAMLDDPKYCRIDGDDPVYGAMINVLKDVYNHRIGDNRK